MIDAQVLAIAHIDEAVVAAPTVRVDDAVELHATANDPLQCGFRAIRDCLGVDMTAAISDRGGVKHPG